VNFDIDMDALEETMRKYDWSFQYALLAFPLTCKYSFSED
jgi:hypothetical protein